MYQTFLSEEASSGFTAPFPGNFEQREAYVRQCAAREGSEAKRIVVTADGEEIASAWLRIFRVPGLPAGLAYISRGPVLTSPADAADEGVEGIIKEVARFAAKELGCALRLNPPIGRPDENAAFRESCRTVLGTQPQETYRSFLVDLAPEEKDLRSGLHAKWRGHLNKSDRAELDIQCGREDRHFDDLAEVVEATAERKGFEVAQGPDFFREIAKAPGGDFLEVFTARSDGELVAATLGDVRSHTGTYILGGTTIGGRAPRAGYALQWQMMLRAKANGCRQWDLGGVDKADNPTLYEFKERTGGTAIEVPMRFHKASGPVQKLLLAVLGIMKK